MNNRTSTLPGRKKPTECRKALKLKPDHLRLLEDCRSLAYRVTGREIPSRPEVVRLALTAYKTLLLKISKEQNDA